MQRILITPAPTNMPRPEAAQKLRRTADAMQATIDRKLNSATSQQRATARRARIVAGMEAEGRALQRVQQLLYALAAGHDAGSVAPELATITTTKQIEVLLRWEQFPRWDDDQARMQRAEITLATYAAARTALLALERPIEATPEQQRRALERSLIGHAIPGFFPTPRAIVDRMLDAADIQPGMTVLEPSAGAGHIADAISDRYPASPLHVIEWNHTLRQILALKGHDVRGDDFLCCASSYERIVMNPPFERFQDITHVRHAYERLTAGGRLVAIMSESAFFRQDRTAQDFRAWLESLDHEVERLEAGAFYSSDRPTGVSTRLVVIVKDEDRPVG